MRTSEKCVALLDALFAGDIKKEEFDDRLREMTDSQMWFKFKKEDRGMMTERDRNVVKTLTDIIEKLKALSELDAMSGEIDRKVEDTLKLAIDARHKFSAT